MNFHAEQRPTLDRKEGKSARVSYTSIASPLPVIVFGVSGAVSAKSAAADNCRVPVRAANKS